MSTEILKRMQVIPGFRELFGRMTSESELRGIVGQYPVSEWLSYLSRFQNMFWGNQARDKKRIRSVFFGALSQELQTRIRAFALESKTGDNLVLFYERQIATLQQYVILHAAPSGDRTFDDETGRHDLGCALLMTWDLMDLGRQHNGPREDLLSCVIQDQIRMSPIPAQQHTARAYYFYDFANTKPDPLLAQYLALYELAIGVNSRDAMLGGLCEVVRESRHNPKDLANAWYSLPEPEKIENEREAVVLKASSQVRWGRLSDIRDTIYDLEDNRPLRDWNLIALSRYPIVRLDDGNAFALNHTALGRSLFDGVRHAVLTAALAKQLPEPFNNPAAVGGLYGKLFQRYVIGVLKQACGDRVVEIPEGAAPRCDLLISYPDKIILIEVKAEHFVAKCHFSYQTMVE